MLGDLKRFLLTRNESRYVDGGDFLEPICRDSGGSSVSDVEAEWAVRAVLQKPNPPAYLRHHIHVYYGGHLKIQIASILH